MMQTRILQTIVPSFSKFGVRHFASQAASSLQEVVPPSTLGDDEYVDLDWNNLGFALNPADYMYTMKSGKDNTFEQGKLSRYGNVELSPSAGVINYGQGLFEGMKAYRRDDGKVSLFRPRDNAMRMQIGAERLCMPAPSVDQFVDAVKEVARSNKHWIPPAGKGALYVRPLLIGTGPILGFAPAPEYTFLIYASPVGNYFKEGTAPLNLYIDEDFHRATRGGAGGIKSITNYAPVLKPLGNAKARGFSDVLYLDSVNKKNLEEVSSCNIFVIKGNTISTPAAVGTILEGITRKSIIQIARDLGYQVEERSVPVDELVGADEVFCTGTAVGVAPVGSIEYQGKRIEYKTSSKLISHQLYKTLMGIQRGTIEDKNGWVVEI
jgi:branched-chain amino acid aminotransferase